MAIELFPKKSRGTMFKHGVIQAVAKVIALGGVAFIVLEVLGVISTLDWVAGKFP